MKYLCTINDNRKMYFRTLGPNDLIIKIVDDDDNLIEKIIVTQAVFKKKYEPLIKDQLNYKHRSEFWENL